MFVLLLKKKMYVSAGLRIHVVSQVLLQANPPKRSVSFGGGTLGASSSSVPSAFDHFFLTGSHTI